MGRGFAPPAGTGSNNILLLGEALGSREVQLGEPFVGDAGAQLNHTLSFLSDNRKDFTITNVVCCQPPSNWLEGAPWEAEAILHCSQYLVECIRNRKPSVIVPMGNVAIKACIGMKGVQKLRGYVYDSIWDDHKCYVVPTYHPSFIMRGQKNLVGVQVFDLQRAQRVAKNGYVEPEVDYIRYPTTLSLAGFYRDAASGDHQYISIDIETPTSHSVDEDEYGEVQDADIIRISFAFREGHAITVPWKGEFLPHIQELLRLPLTHIFWNADFDVPRIKSKGLICDRPIVDGMWAWHMLQSDVPKGLGFVATFYTNAREWKSLSDRQPEYYSCKDADMALQCTLKIVERLKANGQEHAFQRHYIKLQPLVNRMAKSGVLIDPVRQQEFRAEIGRELEATDANIQMCVPMELRPFKARAKVPAESQLGELCRAGGHERWDYHPDSGEWGERSPFLYNSSKQVIKYMRYRSHPVPTNYKTGKETSGADEIERLATKYPDDPLYPRILEARGFRKIIGQYVDGYVPGGDGKVRTNFSRKPSTWRFNSYSPNVQNVLKRAALAGAYRRQFVAAPGFVLVEFDYKAIEAILTAHFAEDDYYLRAAKLGVHAILLSHVRGRPIPLHLPDSEVRALISALKRSDPLGYAGCKMVCHASNYGSTAKRLRIENPDLFATTADALAIQDVYFGRIATKVRAWQQRVLHEAHTQHYLQNPFGYRHWFWDVLKPAGGGRLEWGQQAKQAMAYRPQSTAAGVMSEAILRVAENEDVFRTLRWTIHDSLLAEIPDDHYLPDYISMIRGCMQSPIPELSGLSFEVEISIGPDWGSMHEADADTFLRRQPEPAERTG